MLFCSNLMASESLKSVFLSSADSSDFVFLLVYSLVCSLKDYFCSLSLCLWNSILFLTWFWTPSSTFMLVFLTAKLYCFLSWKAVLKVILLQRAVNEQQWYSVSIGASQWMRGMRRPLCVRVCNYLGANQICNLHFERASCVMITEDERGLSGLFSVFNKRCG